MRCFIHTNVEAISVCKKCGKAMCSDCSSYSQHSGICPECRREEFIEERRNLTEDLRKNIFRIVTSIILAVLTMVLAIWLTVAVITIGALVFVATLVFVVRIVVLFVRRKPMLSRVKYLTGEIDKLTWNLEKGRGTI